MGVAKPTSCPVNSRWTPAQIEVFAAASTPVTSMLGTTVHRVDALQQITAELNSGAMPPDHHMAVATIRQRLLAMGPTFRHRIESALRAAEAFTVYGVQRVPAIVFDGSCVVYGLADIPQAIDFVRRGGGQPISPRFLPGRPAPGGLRSVPTARSSP
jgi:integrating conjugative element protein (TIGR03757 family)